MGTVHRMIQGSGQSLRQESGFTLIETIIVLVIVSIAGAIAGFGMSQALDTFMLNQKSAALIQESDYFMKRVIFQLHRTVNRPQLQITNFNPTRVYLYINNGGLEPDTKSTNSEYFYVTPASGTNDGFISMTTNPESKSLFLISGLGQYGGNEKFLDYRLYDDQPFDYKSDPFDRVAAFDMLLIMKNPTGAGSSLRFATTVAHRNNHRPNMPVPR